jgi:hypothetical protein
MAAHPVTKVVVNFLTPQHYFRPFYDPPVDVWGWLPNRSPALANSVHGQEHYIPPEVHDRLSGGEVRGDWVDYPTRELAVSALSDALIRWAKEWNDGRD